MSSEGTLIETVKMSGERQMALDVILLNNSISQSILTPVVRFYEWEGPYLSIGRNQKQIPNHWLDLAKKGKIILVRRPSGGGGVLHSCGLTYSIIWPKPTFSIKQSYIQTCKWFLKGFKELGLALEFGTQPYNSINENCFSSSSNADLVDSEGNKRIGSAQYWKKGNLLQHGEIILDPPGKLWEEIFNSKPPNKSLINISPEILKENLINSLSACWPKQTWKIRSLNNNEILQIESEAKNYLFCDSKSVFLTNPNKTIDSTTLGKDMPKG